MIVMVVMETGPRPCEGLRVLDLGQGYGALPGMILADYGADVVKVEPPAGECGRAAPAFLQWNRGKRSLVLDLTKEGERAELHRLVSASDVFIHNFRPRTARRLGVADGQLRSLAPHLVHAAISGFGAAGKYSEAKGYEGIVAATCGQFAIQNGYRDGPIYDAVPKCSFGASMLALIGVLAALEAREVTGRGQSVESSLVRANFVYSYTGIEAERAEVSPLLAQVQGRDPHNVMPGYRIARCADGTWIQSGSAAGRTFENMMRALEIDEYFDNPNLREARLLELIDQAYAKAPLDVWKRVLDEHDAAYGTFLTTQEFMDYPQVRHNSHVVAFHDPTVGPTEQIGPLVRFHGTAWRPSNAAPRLGEHGGEVLADNDWRPAARVAPPTANLDAPLAGLTIIDLSMFAAAPGGPGLLADLGARVIKVEPPSGDPLGGNAIGGNELFFRVNRGKERICLDLKTADGQGVLHRLVKKADVVVHNFRPGVPERLGVDFATLRQVNDRIVYVYAASFGSDGPDAHRPAFDAVISALAGGEVLQAGQGNPPQQRQTTDHSALLGVGAAILLGLRECRRTGAAQHLETTMLVSAAYLFSDDFLRYDGKPARRQPDSGQHGLSALYRLYRVRHGNWVFLAAERPQEWDRLVVAIGRSDLAADARFATSDARRDHDEELVAALERSLSQFEAADLESLLLSHDVACVKVADSWTEVALHGDYVSEPDFVTCFDLPGIGRLRQTGAAVVLSQNQRVVPPPEPFGASTQGVLAELGFTEDEITELLMNGVAHGRKTQRGAT